MGDEVNGNSVSHGITNLFSSPPHLLVQPDCDATDLSVQSCAGSVIPEVTYGGIRTCGEPLLVFGQFPRVPEPGFPSRSPQQDMDYFSFTVVGVTDDVDLLS